MHFNLIDEQWIPVTRRNGEEIMIAPWQITEGFDENPIVSLNAPRSDFNGALAQFLIGLIQTTAAPANGIEWKTKLNKPLTPQELQMKFSTVRNAFELTDDGPRFMQDFEDISAEFSNIDGLLIESPGEHTKKLNIDHFVKRDTVVGMCPSCCAMALFAFQTNSPSGGPGFMTSLRGGGPLTTLVLGDGNHETLWQFLFLNILEHDKFLGICGNPNLTEGRTLFPWLGETRKGRRKKGDQFTGEYTMPGDVHPATMFWAMPRRIRLNLVNLKTGGCDVCGIVSHRLINSYKEIPGGASYGGSWLHPLSPYYEKTVQGITNVLPVHAQQGGISYRHWLGFIQEDKDGKRMPARVVHEFREVRSSSNWQFRLWAFGYDMDNMKACCWYEAKMPLLYIDSSFRGIYEQSVAGSIKAATEIAGNVRNSIKKAWFKRPVDVKGDISFLDNSFWQNTESVFYETLYKLKTCFESSHDGIETLQAWHTSLRKEALKLFDAYVLEVPIEDADPKRVVLARRDLELFNNGNKIKELLGLPVVQRQPSKATKKKQKK